MDKKSVLRTIALLFIIFIAIFNYVDRAILTPNAKFILMDLLQFTESQADANTKMIDNLHAIFKWTAAGFTILYGWFNDKYPRKLILTLGALAFGVFSILTSFIQSYTGLVLCQICTGISIGASLPTSFSLLSDLYPTENRSRVFGLFGMSAVLGDVFGNLMVGLIFPVDTGAIPGNPANYVFVNWRIPFLIVGFITIIAAILLFIIVKEPQRGVQEAYLKEMITEESIEYSYRIQKQDLKEIWNTKTNFWLIINLLDNFFGGYMIAKAIPWLMSEHGASSEVAGMLIIIPAVGILLGTVFWGWVGDKWFIKDKAGRVKAMLVCVIVGTILIPVATTMPFDLTGKDLGQALGDGQFLFAFSLFFIFFFFDNGIYPNWHSTIVDANRVEVRGSILSIAIFFEEIGEALGFVLGSAIHDALVLSGSPTPYQTAFLLLMLSLVGGFFLFLPLLKSIKIDIARVEAFNKAKVEQLEHRG
jgi:MFS family permease